MKRTSSVTLALCLSAALPPAAAQELEIQPAVIEGNLTFGRAVSLDRGLALVGAPHELGGAWTYGSAYLFDADPLSPNYGAELIEFVPVDGLPNNKFGCSVSLSGGLALVGAVGDSEGGVSSGSAYLFDADPASPGFGTQLTKFLASDRRHNDWFGWSVSLRDEVALVGARHGNDGVTFSGSAYLFDAGPWSPNLGAELAEFLPSDGASRDFYGCAVALDGGLALVGACSNRGSAPETGSAYLVDADPSSPTFGTELFKFTASDGRRGDLFGIGVSLSGGQALIGASGDDGSAWETGSAYLFQASPLLPNLGQQLAKFTADDEAKLNELGASVSLDGGLALVGQPLGTSPHFPPNAHGAAYLFDATPASPGLGTQITKFVASDGESFNMFGCAVSLSGGLALIGAKWHAHNNGQPNAAGAAYLIETDFACGITNYCVVFPNSAGPGAWINGIGSTSVSAGALSLEVTGCPANEVGMFFYGAGQTEVPFGNGYLCVNGGGVGVFRFPPVGTGDLGSLAYTLDYSSPPQPAGQISSGSTWYFQFWFRDLAGGGAHFNLSDGLEVTFCP